MGALLMSWHQPCTSPTTHAATCRSSSDFNRRVVKDTVRSDVYGSGDVHVVVHVVVPTNVKLKVSSLKILSKIKQPV